jgi:hypothetical protein
MACLRRARLLLRSLCQTQIRDGCTVTTKLRTAEDSPLNALWNGTEEILLAWAGRFLLSSIQFQMNPTNPETEPNGSRRFGRGFMRAEIPNPFNVL